MNQEWGNSCWQRNFILSEFWTRRLSQRPSPCYGRLERGLKLGIWGIIWFCFSFLRHQILRGFCWRSLGHLTNIWLLWKGWIRMKILESCILVWLASGCRFMIYPYGAFPLRSFSLVVAKEIVSIVGNVDSRASEVGCGNAFNFMQLRVVVDTTKPMCRGHKIAMANDKEGWVSFKYERLPNICYWCGMLTHSDRDCLLWEKSRGSLRGKDQ